MTSAVVDENCTFTFSNSPSRSHLNNYKSQRPWNNLIYTCKFQNGSEGLQVCLIKNDITEIDATCILNPLQLYNPNSINKKIQQKADNLYTKEFQAKMNKYSDNISKGYDVLFVTTAGKLINCEYILNFVYPKKDSKMNKNEIFKTSYEYYNKVLSMANTSRIRSLAVPFLILSNEVDECLKAFIESIKKTRVVKENLKFLYLVSEDEEVLKKMDNYLKNGYVINNFLPTSSMNPNAGSQKIKKAKTETLQNSALISEIKHEQPRETSYKPTTSSTQSTITSIDTEFLKTYDQNNNQVTPIEFPKERCDICKKSFLLISNFLNKDYFKLCSNIHKSNCTTCVLANLIAQFYNNYQHTKTKKTVKNFCVVCVGKTIDKLKVNFCSSCLTKVSPNKSILSRYCSNDPTCVKCSGVPGFGLNCYFCEFYSFLDKLTEYDNLILHHDLIKCSFDFCDLKRSTKDEFIKFNCKHVGCSLAKTTTRLCSICAIEKVIQVFSEENNVKIEKIKWEPNKELKFVPKTIVEKISEDQVTKLNKTSNRKYKIDWRLHFDKRFIDEFILLKVFVPNGHLTDVNLGKKVEYNGFVKTIYLPQGGQGEQISEIIEEKLMNGILIELRACESKTDQLIADLIGTEFFKATRVELLKALEENEYLRNFLNHLNKF